MDTKYASLDLDENNNQDIKNNTYTCSVCYIIFNNKLELLRHLSRIHRLTNLCRICYFDLKKIERFANPVSLRNHNLRCHREKMVQCVCGSMLINTNMLMSHLKKFKCDINECEPELTKMIKCVCGKRFQDQEQITLHQSKCRKREKLDTPTCKSVKKDTRKFRKSNKVLSESNFGNSNVETYQRKNSDGFMSSSNNYVYNQNVGMTTLVENERQCNRNFGYMEEKMDEMFRQAVVSSLYEGDPYDTFPACTNSTVSVTKTDGKKENCMSYEHSLTTQMVDTQMKANYTNLDNESSATNRFDVSGYFSCDKGLTDSNNNVADVSGDKSFSETYNPLYKGRQFATKDDNKGRQFTSECKGRHISDDYKEWLFASECKERPIGKGRQFTSECKGRQISDNNKGRQFASECKGRQISDNNKGRQFASECKGRQIISECKGRQITSECDGGQISGKGREIMTNFRGKQNMTNCEISRKRNVIDSNNNDVPKDKKGVAKENINKIKLKTPRRLNSSNTNEKLPILKRLSRQKFKLRKFACKFCGRLYSKPYLYSHLRLAHGEFKWKIIPTLSAVKSDVQCKYRCNWCHFVSQYWTIAVHHHYRLHQDKELELRCLTLP